MAMGWGNFDNMMGGGLLGELTEEEKRRLRMQSMGALGAGLLDGSGWQSTPSTLGQGLAQGIAAGQGAYQQGAIDLSQYKDRKLQRDSELAKAQSEAEGKAELERIIASGEPITPQTAMKIVTLAPSLSNVVQQAMKAQQPKEKLPLSSIGKQAWDMGARPGTPEWDQVYGRLMAQANAPKGGGGEKERDQFRTLSADEVKMAGFAPGTVGQINTATGQIKILSKPEAGKVGDGESGGMNPRQQYASGQLAQNVVNYVAARLGMTPEAARKLSTAEVQQRMAEASRTFEGPVLGKYVPFANADLQPHVKAMASNQAMVNNPTGIVTESDLASAEAQGLSPAQPADVQATLAAQKWDQYVMKGAPETEPAVAAPMSDDEYNALPSGTVYIDPDDGKKYRKP